MNCNRLTVRIFKYCTLELKMANIWFSEKENNTEEFQITHEDITERTPLRNKLHNF